MSNGSAETDGTILAARAAGTSISCPADIELTGARQGEQQRPGVQAGALARRLTAGLGDR